MLNIQKGKKRKGLMRNVIQAGDNKYNPLFLGINGQIGELNINHKHNHETREIHFYSFVVDITKDIILDKE